MTEFKPGDKIRMKNYKEVWTFIAYLPKPDDLARDIVVERHGTYAFGKAVQNELVPLEFEVGKKYRWKSSQYTALYEVVDIRDGRVIGWKQEVGREIDLWADRARFRHNYVEAECD